MAFLNLLARYRRSFIAFGVAVTALVLILASCATGSSRNSIASSGAPAAVANAPRPDWERTLPTIALRADGSRVVDLSDFFGGWIEGGPIRWISRAEDCSPEWKPRAPDTSSAGPGAATPVAPRVRFLDEERGTLPYRLEITPASSASSVLDDGDGELWFVSLSVRVDSVAAPVERVLAVRSRGATPADESTPRADFYPIPLAVEPRLSRHDGGFAFVPEAPGESLIPETLHVLFGNEPIPLAAAGAPKAHDTASNAASDALSVVWLDPERFAIRGLRAIAAERLSDCLVRVIAKTSEGRWIESAFPFGGVPRSYFDPRDAVLYLALTDRLPDGDAKNSAPLPNSVEPLDNWNGGDTAGVRGLLAADYFHRLGATCIVLSPPYRQAAGPIPAAASPASTSTRPTAPYRGLWPDTFTEPDPHYGSWDDWKATVAAIHKAGHAILLGFCPWMVHEKADLVAERPDWYRKTAGDFPGLSRATQSARNRPNRADFFAPFLRYASFDTDTEAVERMTGYGLFWTRLTGANGLYCYAGDQLPAAFWRRLARRLREEVARPEDRGIFLLGEPLAAGSAIPSGDSSTPASIGLEGTVDFPLSVALRETLGAGRGDLGKLDALSHFTLDRASPGVLPCVVSGTPDLARVASLAPTLGSAGGDEPQHPLPGQAADRSHRLFFTALLTLPVVPAVYYGDEIGLRGDAGSDACAPLPPEAQWNSAQQRRFDRVRFVATLRPEHPSLRRGSFQTLAVTRDAWVYCRAAWSDAVVIALNRSAAPIEIEVILPANLRGADRLVPFLSGDTPPLPVRAGKASLRLPPGSATLWEAGRAPEGEAPADRPA